MSELKTLYQGCLLEVIPQLDGSYRCSYIPPCASGVYICEKTFQTVDEAMEEARAKAIEISLENSLFDHIVSILVKESGRKVHLSDPDQLS